MTDDSQQAPKERKALLRAVAEGDAIALQALLHVHRLKLKSYIHRHLPNALVPLIDPEDVVQDVCIEAFRYTGQLKINDDEAFERWLLTVARNRMTMLLRAAKSQKRGGDFRRLSA